MIKIKDRDICVGITYYDYELEDGTLLHEDDWDGEQYIFMKDGIKQVYYAIYEDEVYYTIIGFEKMLK